MQNTPFTGPVLRELRTSILDVDEGSADGFAKAGELIRHTADEVDDSSAAIDALTTTIGTPTDTDIATDIANVQTVVDDVNTNVGDASGDTLTSLVTKLGDDTLTVKERFDAIVTHIDTTGLDAGEGSNANEAALALLVRFIADNAATSILDVDEGSAAGNSTLKYLIRYLVDNVAMTGADSDTLETLSDQIDGIPTGDANTEIETTTLDAGEGSIANTSRAGLIIRWLGDNLNSLVSYIGTFTRSFKTQWGTKYDSTGDLGTDVGTIITSTGTTIPNLHAVPTKDAATDTNMRDVIGKKDDTAVVAVGTDKSILGYAKGAISLLAHGTYGLSALQTLIAAIPTTAMRGTDNAFLASNGGTSADDHEDATLFGWIDKTYDMASAAHDDAATAAGHNNPDAAGTAASLHAITNSKIDTIDGYHDVPTKDGTADAQMRDVIGKKDDTASFALVDTDSLMSYIKGLVTAGIAVAGAVSDAAPATTDFDTDLTEASDDHYIGGKMIFYTGNLTGQARHIEDYDGTSKNCDFTAITSGGWTEAPANGDKFIIVPDDLGTLLYGVWANNALIGGLNDVSTSEVNTEVDNALNTAIPGSPTANSVNERIASMDNRILVTMPVFWSESVASLAIDSTAGDENLPNVVVSDIPTGGTPVLVKMLFKYSKRIDSSGSANMTDSAQTMSIDADSGRGSVVTAIDIPTDSFHTAASASEGGDVIIGDNDVSAEVTGNGTYYPTWELADVDGDSLTFRDVQVGLQVTYSI